MVAIRQVTVEYVSIKNKDMFFRRTNVGLVLRIILLCERIWVSDTEKTFSTNECRVSVTEITFSMNECRVSVVEKSFSTNECRVSVTEKSFSVNECQVNIIFYYISVLLW